jgi:ubiquinone/menaquinone biosynthesis C-methylase UbiE
VLDLGCGSARAMAKHLVHFRITGVDISPSQIGEAQRHVPQGDFICADMTEITFPPHNFDAVIALYSIIHVPLAQQPSLFTAIARWLTPSGYFLATLGHTTWTGVEENWLSVSGATMYWSHADAATYRSWLVERGFAIISERFVPESSGGHVLFLSQAPNAS